MLSPIRHFSVKWRNYRSIQLPKFNKLTKAKFWLSILLLICLGLMFCAIQTQLNQWKSYFRAKPWVQFSKISDPIPLAPHERAEYERAWQKYGFNAWLAERLPIKRHLPDVRDKQCLRNLESSGWFASPWSVSIIIAYRNELPAMLLRTLHSIEERTNSDVINELLLVDDNSDMSEAEAKSFDYYVSNYLNFTVRIFRFPESVGLIRARNFAADEAEAEYLVFLPPNVEVTAGWLEPLLLPIDLNEDTVTVPALDRLDEQTLDYRRVPEHLSVFDWSFRLRQVPLKPAQQQALPLPFPTPMLEDAAFAVNSDWFQSYLFYEDGLRGSLGGEIELSLKIWSCGGNILQVPCSRIAQLQRSNLDYLSSYGNVTEMGRQQYKNYKRIAEVWLDEYKVHLYDYQPQIKRVVPGNLSQLLADRRSCESFDWYLKTVASALLEHFPLGPRVDFAVGSLRLGTRNSAPMSCLTADLNSFSVRMQPCEINSSSPSFAAQNWTLSYMRDIRLSQAGLNDLCLELRDDITPFSLGLGECHNLGGRQFWFYDVQTHHLATHSNCLTLNGMENILYVTACNGTNEQQIWHWDSLNEKALDKFYY